MPVFWYQADVNHDNAPDFLVRALVTRSGKRKGSEELLVLTGGPYPAIVELDNARFTSGNHPERVAPPLHSKGRAYVVYRT
ncbi:hypothetical protein [Hymenobacter sp. 102]|uniref:hypothetical protein n=1 Tax=Hymenobacter sp. 102 TaxID=3403152 RepID=UPI003CEA47D9